MNAITTICIILGAGVIGTAPILFVLWWGDKISH